ncbi:protein kinase [Streptomyces sp. 5-8]|uniref:Protein kinase n=1 Tax=Streptomyces musisoli TaxID=2802280 RepID=A0ABS1P6Q7_9ACTN|nr:MULTISPECIES: serine/threonine-protein kinase [Streptomyces]MBL1108050.1 protein kinase [Streptomyces musisoli]MBY8841415.1 serine/threonine-protein kinase [Streptomyces sp. SP2-10]
MRPLGTGDPIRLGPYRLLGVLGEGGMGKVYVGQDHARTVAAVKVLRPELAHDTHLAQRFVREALAAQAVRSPGVAAVLGAHTEGGRPWIATEFLAGPTLDQIVDRHGPLDDTRLRALAASVARTLGDIHAAGFVHRDLKPPNIVLTATGPRIIDFGIARPEHGLTLTTTGQIPVTPGYGAPEQVLGRRVTPAADVFSLGAVLVYAATGHRAFQGAHVAAVQYEVVHGEPDWQGVTPEQHALIAPCLAKDAAARPTPEQIATAFAGPKKAAAVWRRGPVADAIKEREREVRELSAPLLTTQTGAAPSRRRLLTGFAAGGAVLAAAGTGTGWWLMRGGGSARHRDDLFSYPPAARTPAARLLSADDGDYIIGGSPEPLWTAAGVSSRLSPAPLPVRDVVIVGNPVSGVVALNAVDGKRRWSAPAMQMTCRYLSLSDRLLVAADDHGTLHTFVPSTGEPKWTAKADAKTLLTADTEAVYLLTKDQRLRAVGRSDARIRWTVPVPADFRGKLLPRSVAHRGRLVVTTTTGHAMAVDTRSGRTEWTARDLAKDRYLFPAVRDGVVYLNGRGLTARRISDGRELWSHTRRHYYDSEDYEWSRPCVYGDMLYSSACDDYGYPYGFALPAGKQRWDAGLAVNGNDHPIVLQGNGVWLLDGSTVRTVSKDDASEVWSYEIPFADDDDVAFTAAGNRVFLANAGSLKALPVF